MQCFRKDWQTERTGGLTSHCRGWVGLEWGSTGRSTLGLVGHSWESESGIKLIVVASWESESGIGPIVAASWESESDIGLIVVASWESESDIGLIVGASWSTKGTRSRMLTMSSCGMRPHLVSICWRTRSAISLRSSSWLSPIKPSAQSFTSMITCRRMKLMHIVGQNMLNDNREPLYKYKFLNQSSPLGHPWQPRPRGSRWQDRQRFQRPSRRKWKFGAKNWQLKSEIKIESEHSEQKQFKI